MKKFLGYAVVFVVVYSAVFGGIGSTLFSKGREGVVFGALFGVALGIVCAIWEMRAKKGGCR